MTITIKLTLNHQGQCVADLQTHGDVAVERLSKMLAAAVQICHASIEQADEIGGYDGRLIEQFEQDVIDAIGTELDDSHLVVRPATITEDGGVCG